jgi:hypothetical protein
MSNEKSSEAYHESHLYRIRHSTAHLMAAAVLEMFPEGKVAIGPPIENGFYYDFDLPRALTPEDLAKIESRMRALIAGREDFVYEEITAEKAEASRTSGAASTTAGGYELLYTPHIGRAAVGDLGPPGLLPREHVRADGRSTSRTTTSSR